MRSLRCFATCLFIVSSLSAPGVAQEAEEHGHSHLGSEEGLGRAHMEISCSPAVAAKFDRALALLHNFWYGRALVCIGGGVKSTAKFRSGEECRFHVKADIDKCRTYWLRFFIFL